MDPYHENRYVLEDDLGVAPSRALEDLEAELAR